MRLIDADALKGKFINANVEGINLAIDRYALKCIDDAPTIEPERRKGRWINHPEQKNIYGGVYVECSECGEKYVVQYIKDEKFCRNCGANMRG